MSGFLGGGAGNLGPVGGLRAPNKWLLAEPYDGDEYLLIALDAPWTLDGYRSRWWPRSSLDATGGEWLEISPPYDRPELNTGAIAKRGFSGYTRDVNGVTLGGCTVRLFRTSDGLLTCQVVSDANGWFVLDTQFYPDTHFYTAHKADVPEVAGASPSTLVAG